MAAHWPNQVFPAQQYQQQPQQYQHPQYQQQSPQHQQPNQNQLQGQYQQNGQYQQLGQYQQQGQYQQSGQYSQRQQFQPNQQHQPNQNYQSQHQGYNSYQQQYAPQHHPSQQYSPPHRHTPQYGAFPQPSQQQAKPIPVNPQPCFNCGSPDHFAQDCPEPKREVPAGALEPHKFQNPLKRPRPGGSFGNGFQAPSHAVPTQAPPQGYPPAPQNQPGYPQQHQAQYSPATPASAQSPAQQQQIQQQWQQYYQWQAYQQGNQHQQGTPQQQLPYSANSNHAGGHPNGHQQPSQSSPPQGSQYAPSPQIYQSQHAQIPSASATIVQSNQQPMGTAPDASVGQRYQQMAPSASVHSGSPQAKLQKSQIAYDEFEEDDLESLDISDLPQSPSTFANGRLPNTIIGPPIKLIGTPLPANFVVADTLYPIAPPENEHDGRCRSKYVRSAEINEEQENIEYSKYWSDHQDDPIFAERPSDESTMSIEDALAKVKQSFVDGEVRDESTKSRSQSRSDSVRRESVDKYSALASIEQNIAEEKARLAARLAELERKKKLQNGKYKLSSQPSTPGDRQGMVKQEQQTSPQLSTSKQSWESDRDTEAVLVALGVTGSPKPVDTGPLPSYRGGPPDDNLNSTDTPHQPNDRSSSGSTPHFQGSGPRPPPFRQDFHPSGAGGSPLSAGTGYVNAQNYNANGADYTNGHSDYGADGQIQSPVGSRSEKSMSRKRSFARRDSPSDEEDTPARRQQDDITPKLKKRQPKVAEAYSRRW